MTRLRKLEQYRIMPDFNAQALRREGMTHRAYRDAIIAKEKGILDAMRQQVKDIVKNHAGIVVRDAAEFSIPGTTGQFGNYMIIHVPNEALAELKKFPETKVEKFVNSEFRLP